MPYNKHGGKKSRKTKNFDNQNRETRIAKHNEGEYYGKVERPLGSCRFEVILIPSNESKTALIAGGIKKRTRILKDDYVIISSRECDTRDNAPMDIIHKYSPDDVSTLKKMNLLSTISVNDETQNNNSLQIHFNTNGLEEAELDEREIDDEDIINNI